MSVEDAKAALAGLEGKLSDAMARRDKIIIEISRAADKAAAIGGIGDQSAKMSLGPLNKQANVIAASAVLAFCPDMDVDANKGKPSSS